MTWLSKELKEKMTDEEIKKFENLENKYMEKRFVTSKILNRSIVPKWLQSLEEQFKDVIEDLREDIQATGELELKEDFVQALYGVDPEDIKFGKFCKLFWVQRRFAIMMNYLEYLENKYLSDDNEHETSEKDIDDLKSNKGK